MKNLWQTWLAMAAGVALAATDGGRGVTVAPVATTAPSGNAGLFVGVNQFTPDTSLRPLDFAVNDAIAQAHLFVVELKLIPPANCVLALAGVPSTDSAKAELAALEKNGVKRVDALRTSILASLVKVRALSANPSDLLVVAISSHGFDDRGKSFVMPSDGMREMLEESAIKIESLNERLKQAKAGKRLLLIDACRERASSESRGADQPMTSAFRTALAQAEGQATLAACDAGQLSLENRELGHGVFTYFLLQALHGQARADERGYITLGAISDYVAQSVKDWVVRNKSGIDPRAAQRPWFEGPLEARQIPLAVDSGVQARMSKFKGDVLAAADALRGKINRKGEFNAAMYERVAEKLEQAQDNEAGQKLLAKAKDFASGKLDEETFVAYIEKHVLGKAPTVSFKQQYIQALRDLQARVEPAGPVPRDIYDMLVRGCALISDESAPDSQGRAMFVALQQATQSDEAARAFVAKMRAAQMQSQQIPAQPTLTQPTLAIPTQAVIVKPTQATKDQPWVNSLGMKFVPVKGTDVLFSIWLTRVQDFEAFVKATGYDATADMESVREDGWKKRGDTWKSPGFTQGPTHPVCGVSWEDAKAFCQWLTEKERKEKLFAVGCEYRLPTETEWNVGVGSTSKYPWGDEWPPPRGAGNYAGEEVQQAGMPSYWTGIPGYNDGYPRTSPVGSFAANQFGLFDMGGNLCQWCEDVFKPYSNELCRVLRGDGWESRHPSSLDSSKRNFYLSGARVDYRGFRCVLVVGSSSSR